MSVVGSAPVALLFGLGAGAGLWLIMSGLRGRTDPTPDMATGYEGQGRSPRRFASWWRRNGTGVTGGSEVVWWASPAARLGRACLIGIVLGLYTRWLVAGVLGAAAVQVLPAMIGSDPRIRTRIARVEAIASWTEMLRDTLAAAAGLEQAITATAKAAPVAIREQVQDLGARLERGSRLPNALRAFADDLSDPIADLVVVALVLASQHQARQLGDLLGNLATTAREQVTMRLRVDAGRARTRTSVRVIITVTLLMAGALIVLNRAYLTPYDSASGQLVLAVIGAVFTLALWWLARIATIGEPARVLTGLDSLTPAAAQSLTPEGALTGSSRGWSRW